MQFLQPTPDKEKDILQPCCRKDVPSPLALLPTTVHCFSSFSKLHQIDSFSMRFRIELNDFNPHQNDRIQIRAALDRQLGEHHQLLKFRLQPENHRTTKSNALHASTSRDGKCHSQKQESEKYTSIVLYASKLYN